MSAMGTGLAELDGSPSEDMIAFYEARALGGAGLIIPEITRINDVNGAGLMRQLSVTKDKHIEPLSRLAQAVQKHGSKIFIQLHHPGRQTVSALIGGQPVVAPSAIMCKYSLQETRALENEEIKQLVQQFVDGAVRVKKAGCDGVELHAAHGYLINQFLSPYTNKREDEYGGSFENRMRFISEIIQGIRKECGDFPISVRLSVDEFLDKTGVNEDYIHIEDGVKIAMVLERLGIDVINVSCGTYETGIVSVEPISFPQGWRRDFIKAVKDNVHIPVIGVSVIREPDVAEQFLTDEVVDFVGLGRPWLADEEWGKKVLEGREEELCKCISCLRCFESLMEYNGAGMPLECAVNARMARERKYGELVKDTEGHKVVVVGAGPAGLSAARTLAMRGVHVILLEKRSEMGGLIEIAKKPPLKERMNWLTEHYEYELNRLGVDVHLNTEATVELLQSYNPDAIILATGSNQIVPRSIPGIFGENVYSVEDILSGQAGLKNKKIVLIGAGMTGIETAEYLCDEGNSVNIVDMQDKIAPEGNPTNVLDVKSRLDNYDVEYMLAHSLKEIGPDGIFLVDMKTKQEIMVPADAVVLSLGLKPNNELRDALKEKFENVHDIGDAVKVGRIGPAVRGGYEIGRKLFSNEPDPRGFVVDQKTVDKLAETTLMGDQEGLYISYLTDPEAIRRILPPGLEPFAMPVVTLSITHIKKPSFAEDYYETILGCYAMRGETVGMYLIALMLGGPGSEMATQLGRDTCGLPKKLGADFRIQRNGNTVTASVARKGVQLIDAKMEIGEYNSPIADAIYQSPKAGKTIYGNAFYYMFDRKWDADGKSHFVNARLLENLCEYKYNSWEPGFTSLKLNSSIDDPWAELPINTIIGGAYSNNDLYMRTMTEVEYPDVDSVIPYLMFSRYDRTAFMETGRND